MDDLTGSSMAVDFMKNEGEIKTGTLTVDKLVVTHPVRTTKQLFTGAFAVTSGVVAAIGTFVFINSAIEFMGGFINGLFGG